MRVWFRFPSDGQFEGEGEDDVGPFTFRGMCKSGKVRMTKHYPTHVVEYWGWFEDGGITGSWRIPLSCSGEFRLRPSKPEPGSPA